MRSDMQYVLVERPRDGRGVADVLRRQVRRRSNHKVRTGDVDNLSSKETMGRGRNYGWHAKQLTDNLNPLFGYLRKNVGRPWDKVYAEIRANINPNSTLQQHILDHVNGLVCQYVKMDEVTNEPLVPSGYAFRDEAAFTWQPYGHIYGRSRWPQFYVNPVTGLLCVVKVLKHKPKEQPPLNNLVVKGIAYMKVNGIWYMGDMRPVPRPWGTTEKFEVTERHWDRETGAFKEVTKESFSNGPVDFFCGTIGGKHKRNEAMRFYGRLTHYCAGRGHQLDTKALRALGLTNDT